MSEVKDRIWAQYGSKSAEDKEKALRALSAHIFN
jgi:hypothetical protein